MSKSILKNAFFNAFYKALSVFFPLITVSYASRILGPSGIGQVSSAQNIVTYFTMAASLGIPIYGVREIAKVRNDSKLMSKTFLELMSINFIATTICSMLYFIVIHVNVLKINKELGVIFGVLLICNYINCDWFYQANERYSYIAVRSLIIKLLSIIFLFCFVTSRNDVYIYASIICFGTIGNYFLNIIKIKKDISIKKYSLNLKKHLKSIFVFFAAVIAVELYSLIDVTMLTHMCSSNIVGTYSNVVKIIKTFAGTITAVGVVLLPRLSFYFAEKNMQKMRQVINEMLKIILLISIPCVVGIILISDNVILFMFGEEFLKGISTCRILAPLILFMPISGGIASQVLQTFNKENDYLFCLILGAITNVILNYFLIPKYLQDGAAVASLITEGLITLSMLFKSHKLLKYSFDSKFMMDIIIASIAMLIILLCLKKFELQSNILEISLNGLVGCGVYGITLLIRKNEIMLCAIKKLQYKFFK